MSLAAAPGGSRRRHAVLVAPRVLLLQRGEQQDLVRLQQALRVLRAHDVRTSAVREHSDFCKPSHAR